MSFLYVKAYYGPSNTFGCNIHKPQLLSGIRDRLQKLGFRVDLLPVEFSNYCMLEMCGHEVFRCNIKNLKFNMHTKRDAVSERAVQAVIQSSVKFRRARAFLWFWTLMDHQLFRRGAYAPKDFWPVKLDLKPLASCSECLDCCNILVTKEKKEEEDYFPQKWKYIVAHRLQKLGFRVDLLPVEFANYCMLEICGHEVFRCNLKHLKFNMHTKRDAVSERAVQAVIQSSVKFRRARAFLWFWTLMDHQLFRRSAYAPKDFWPVKFDLKPLAGCSECLDCCNILVSKEKKEDEKEELFHHKKWKYIVARRCYADSAEDREGVVIGDDVESEPQPVKAKNDHVLFRPT